MFLPRSAYVAKNKRTGIKLVLRYFSKIPKIPPDLVHAKISLARPEIFWRDLWKTNPGWYIDTD